MNCKPLAAPSILMTGVCSSPDIRRTSATDRDRCEVDCRDSRSRLEADARVWTPNVVNASKLTSIAPAALRRFRVGTHNWLVLRVFGMLAPRAAALNDRIRRLRTHAPDSKRPLSLNTRPLSDPSYQPFVGTTSLQDCMNFCGGGHASCK